MRPRIIVLVLFSLVIGTIASLGLAELALRAAGVSSRLVYEPNPNYGWGLAPNDSFAWNTEGRTLEIETNSKGLRDYEHTYEKPADVTRVLVLGDSFIEALQVELDDSFAGALQSTLNGDSGGVGLRRRVEVINAGVSGYGTDNALLFFEHEGYRYQPDLVLLGFYLGNDVRNNWHVLEERDAGGARKPHYEVTADGLAVRRYPFAEHTRWSTRARVFLNRHSRLYALIRESANRLRRGGAPPDDASARTISSVPLDLELFQARPPAVWDDAWNVTRAILGELNDRVEESGAMFMAFAIPTAAQVDEAAWNEKVASTEVLRAVDWAMEAPNARFAEICRQERIRCLDLLPALRAEAAAAGRAPYFPEDSHWNEAGHRAAAGAVADAIRESLR